MTPHGSIVIADGAVPQTFDATARKLLNFTANGDHSSYDEGDERIIPDYANNRIKVKKGNYLCLFSFSGAPTLDVGTLTLMVRKNGTEVASLGCDQRIEGVSSADARGVISGILECTEADQDSERNIAVEIYGEASFDVSSSDNTSSSNSSSSSSTTNSSSSSSTNSSSSSSSSNSSSNSSSSSSTTNSSSSSINSSSSSTSTNSSSSSTNSSSSSTSSGDESSSSSSSSTSSNSSSSSSSTSSLSTSSSSVVGGPRLTVTFAQLTLIGLD